jgi:hypothetical protein
LGIWWQRRDGFRPVHHGRRHDVGMDLTNFFETVFGKGLGEW